MSVGQQGVRSAELRSSVGLQVSATTGFVLIVAAYLVLHIALRLWETPLIGKNDVQEAVSAQAWAWGYHPRNPPLHTWLLMGAYGIFGERLVAHVMLKYVLLGGLYGFAFLCARRLVSNTNMAVLAALSLTLLGPFAWTVHTALTHTLLMAVIVLGALWAAMRLTERQRAIDYALFGLMIGLGLLAKYSFSLFLGSLLATMLSLRDLRRPLADWRLLISAGVALLLLAPHLLWALHSSDFNVIAFLAEKQQSETPHPYLVEVGIGVGNVIVGALSFLALIVIVMPILFGKLARAEARPPSPWQKAVTLICGLGLGLLLVDVLVIKATQFEERYFMCALLVAPLAICQWIDRRAPSPASLRLLGAAIGAVALIAFGGLAGRALLSHQTCNRCWEEMRVDRLSQALRESGFSEGTIIADHYNLAGNMRLDFPLARSVAANYEAILPPASGRGQCALVWNARNAGDPLPPDLADYLRRVGFPPVQAPPRYVEAPLRRSRDRIDRFGYVIVPGVDGACRANFGSGRAEPNAR